MASDFPNTPSSSSTGNSGRYELPVEDWDSGILGIQTQKEFVAGRRNGFFYRVEPKMRIGSSGSGPPERPYDVHVHEYQDGKLIWSGLYYRVPRTSVQAAIDLGRAVSQAASSSDQKAKLESLKQMGAEVSHSPNAKTSQISVAPLSDGPFMRALAERSARSDYTNGKELMKQGSHGQAAASFKRVLANDPKNLGAANLLGDAHLALGSMAEAGQAYQQAQQLRAEGIITPAPSAEEARTWVREMLPRIPGPAIFYDGVDPDVGPLIGSETQTTTITPLAGCRFQVEERLTQQDSNGRRYDCVKAYEFAASDLDSGVQVLTGMRQPGRDLLGRNFMKLTSGDFAFGIATLSLRAQVVVQRACNLPNMMSNGPSMGQSISFTAKDPVLARQAAEMFQSAAKACR